MASFNPLKWKSRNLVYVFLGIVTFYGLFVYKKSHRVTSEATIKNSKPEAIWEFVADFSNMKKLNPTLEDFSIIAESGNLDHWKYSVKYTEHLSHVPWIRNTAHGHYNVKPDGEGFSIGSQHRVCFFFGFGCVDSISIFTFHAIGKDTKCKETVEYECPIVFSMLCYKEVVYQRHEIMKGLKKHFSIGKTEESYEK